MEERGREGEAGREGELLRCGCAVSSPWKGKPQMRLLSENQASPLTTHKCSSTELTPQHKLKRMKTAITFLTLFSLYSLRPGRSCHKEKNNMI